MIHAVILILGIAIGGWLAWFGRKKDVDGTLYFYKSEPGEPPTMLVELDESPDVLQNTKLAIFHISHK